MKTFTAKAEFDQRYQTHLQHLKLKGLQPKSIDAYSRAIRHMGDYFDFYRHPHKWLHCCAKKFTKQRSQRRLVC